MDDEDDTRLKGIGFNGETLLNRTDFRKAFGKFEGFQESAERRRAVHSGKKQEKLQEKDLEIAETKLNLEKVRCS